MNALILHAPSRLVARGLSKGYKKRQVVEDVHFDVKAGEAVALLGPNGAGKTTCFYMLAGLILPDSGTITLDDTDVTHLPLYRRARLGIGYLPQEASVFRSLTVEENILAVLELGQPSPVKRKQIVEELLEEFSLTHIRRSLAITLSGGERRRTEIARALATNPRFLLLDEPLAGIDPIAIQEIRLLIETLRGKNIGVLITDHNVRDTLDIVTYGYILAEGRILAEGTPEDLQKNSAVREHYLGEKY